MPAAFSATPEDWALIVAGGLCDPEDNEELWVAIAMVTMCRLEKNAAGEERYTRQAIEWATLGGRKMSRSVAKFLEFQPAQAIQ